MAEDLRKLYQTKFYRVWYNMKTRCTNKNYVDFHRYGERGITFCDEWINFGGFYKDMYESYLEHLEKFGDLNTTFDRIDNDKGYSKDNCRWATCREQAINRGNTKLVEFNGMKLTLSDWARFLGIKRSTISQRYYTYKWDLAKCLNQ